MNMKHDESRTAIENARILARQQGVSLGKLERLCGLSRGYLTRSLKTDYGMSLHTAVMLATALHVGLEELVSGPGASGNREDQLLALDMQIARLQLRRVEIMANKKII